MYLEDRKYKVSSGTGGHFISFHCTNDSSLKNCVTLEVMMANKRSMM